MSPAALPEWFHQMGLMAWPLAVCSVVSLAWCCERAVFLAKNHWHRKTCYRRLSDCLHEHKEQAKPVRDEIVGIMLNDLQGSYYRGINSLRLIGMISPMIGLLGTILGIISAFKEISLYAAPLSPNVIAAGLWEAMLTTAAGLLIALPTLLMAYLFKQWSERQLQTFCLQLNRLSLSFELEKTAGRRTTTSSKIKLLA